MLTYPDCIPCLFRQALATARRVTDDDETLRGALIELAKFLARSHEQCSPAEFSYDGLMAVQRFLGVDDPYKEEKDSFNKAILELEGHLQEIIDESDDPLHMAVRLAAAGNMIDLGIVSDVNIDDHIRAARETGFAVDDYDLLRQRLEDAETILYVLDNAGEIVFDKLLIRHLAADHIVTAVVRRSPVLNDVTMDDAVYVGIDKLCEVIDTGCDVFGVPVELVSQEFLRRFDAADVRIAKGHANFETLDGCGREIFFLLKAKCQSVAGELGVNLYDSVLMCQAAS